MNGSYIPHVAGNNFDNLSWIVETFLQMEIFPKHPTKLEIDKWKIVQQQLTNVLRISYAFCRYVYFRVTKTYSEQSKWWVYCVYSECWAKNTRSQFAQLRVYSTQRFGKFEL